ncbi:MAG: NPCBM/NEW2 domain-containing protein [Planctomycetes bacterium]|nr:NPCBM/NEW2 domain-containing protein [Planctomycetota bacterium]
MTAWPALLMFLATAAPPVEVATLKGEQHVGNLERLTADEVVLKTPTGSVSLPSAELLAIRVPGPDAPPASTAPTFEIRLVDATILRATSFTSSTTQATLTHSQMGELKLPLNLIRSIRFAPPDPKVETVWLEMTSKTGSRKDQIAVRKNDVLDRLDGVIGSVDESTIKFQLDGDDIPVKRDRVFGLIYARRELMSGRTAATIDLTTGDQLFAKTVLWDGNAWKVKLVSGADLTVPAASVRVVDYSQGKIAYLSNMEPRDVRHTPFFDFVWDYRRDRSFDGQSLSLGNRTYSKGLSVHSLTVLKYRIGGDYRRFQTLFGIDDSLRAGNADVTIKGDGKVLFKGAARAGQSPQPLDLDVTGVVELEITVGFGEDELDIGDRVLFVDAKVVK